MLVVQVDVIHAESRERYCYLFPDKLGITASTGGTYSELGREEDFVPLSCTLEPDGTS